MMLKSNVKPKLGGEVYTVRCMIQEQVMFWYILELHGINQPRNEWGYL